MPLVFSYKPTRGQGAVGIRGHERELFLLSGRMYVGVCGLCTSSVKHGPENDSLLVCIEGKHTRMCEAQQ